MNGSSSFTNLIHNVFDLITKTFVFSSYLIKLCDRFFICTFHLEKIGGGVSALLLRNIKVHAKEVHLAFPFGNDSIQFFSLGYGIGFIFASPHCSFSFAFVCLSACVLSRSNFFVILSFKTIYLMFRILEFSYQ